MKHLKQRILRWHYCRRATVLQRATTTRHNGHEQRHIKQRRRQRRVHRGHKSKRQLTRHKHWSAHWAAGTPRAHRQHPCQHYQDTTHSTWSRYSRLRALVTRTNTHTRTRTPLNTSRRCASFPIEICWKTMGEDLEFWSTIGYIARIHKFFQNNKLFSFKW